MRRVLLAVAMAAVLLSQAPLSAAGPSRDVLRVSGAAGTQAVVTFARAVELERFPQDRLGMDRGDVAAVTVVQLGTPSPVWYARHRMSPHFACGGRSDCFTFAEFEDEVTGSDMGSGSAIGRGSQTGAVRAANTPSLPGIRLPAGRYSIALVGTPGAKVSVNLRARGLGAARTITTRGLPSATLRPVQVVSPGAATWSAADISSMSARTFEGFVVGIGFGQVSQIDVDVCLGSQPAPAAVGCAGEGRYFSSNPGDTGDSGLSFAAGLNVLSNASQRQYARATYVEAGNGGGMQAVRYAVVLPS